MEPAGSPQEAQGLCIAGEALIDFLPAKTDEGEGAYRGVPGGSPFNCCIAAQRLGLQVTFLGALSTDLFGEQLHAHLTREGVDMALVSRLARPSTLAFVCRSAGEGEKYAFFKENAADRSLTKAGVAEALQGRRFGGVHVSLGAVTLEHEPCAEAFQELLSTGGKQGSLRSFDPNIRANMITEGPEAYSKRVEQLLAEVDLVKTSEEDMEFLYGKGAAMPELAGKWLKLGPKLVVLTRGSKGAEAFFSRGQEAPASLVAAPPGERPNTINAEGKPVPVVDSVGAGDTFMGGLLSGCLGASLLQQLVEGKAWDDAAAELLQSVLRRAAVCAAITCSRAGANPPKAAEVDQAMGQLPA